MPGSNRILVSHSLLFAAACAAKVPKALLINLPRHRERLESVKEQFEAQDIRFLRAPAVDGKLLTDEELRQNVTALGRALTTRGMMGCFLSHRTCWQKCVELGEPVLVFEDDGASPPPNDRLTGTMLFACEEVSSQCVTPPLRAVVLSDNFNSVLSAAIKELPDDWDVLLVGALGAVHPRCVSAPGRSRPHPGAPPPPPAVALA